MCVCVGVRGIVCICWEGVWCIFVFMEEGGYGRIGMVCVWLEGSWWVCACVRVLWRRYGLIEGDVVRVCCEVWGVYLG